MLTERKSFDTVVRSSLQVTVDPRVVSVALGLRSGVPSSVVETVGMVLTSEAKETALGLAGGGPPYIIRYHLHACLPW